MNPPSLWNTARELSSGPGAPGHLAPAPVESLSSKSLGSWMARGTGRGTAVWKACLRLIQGQSPECAGAACPPKTWAWNPRGLGRERVFLEGRAYCTRCWPAALALRFAACASAPVPRTRAHRIPLGLVLLSRGWLTPGQLREGLDRQRRFGGRLGESLRALGYAHEDEITAGLATQWACPVLFFRSAVSERHLRRVPLHLQERHRMIPVHYSEPAGVLVLAFSEGVDYALTQAVAGMLDCRIEPCLAPETGVRRNLNRLRDLQHSSGSAFERIFERVRGTGEMSSITESYVLRWDAQRVRVAVCGASVWARLEKAGQTLDLLFDAAPESRRPESAV